MDIEFYSLFYIVWLVSAKVIGVVGVEGDLVSSVRSQRAVLFPQYTVLQVTMAMVIPIEVPQRKLGLNLAVQCNFNLPYTPKEFYKPPFWATRRSHSDQHEEAVDTSRKSRALVTSNYPSMATGDNELEYNDISIDEFYSFYKDYLLMEGYEEDCLEKAICEMSKYPLEHQHDNLLSELLHFVYSPSRHAEQLRNQSAHLHAAEEHGLQFGDCDRIYKCHQSPLEHVTVLEHSDESAMGS